MNGQGDHTGKTSQPHPDNHDQPPHNRIDSTDDIQNAAYRVINGNSAGDARHDIMRGQKADRDGQDGREKCRHQAHGYGFDQGPCNERINLAAFFGQSQADLPF